MLIQNIRDIRDTATIDDLTIQGILFSVILALGAAVVFLYKQNQKMQKEFITELKANNDAIIKVNNSYNDFIEKMDRITRNSRN